MCVCLGGEEESATLLSPRRPSTNTTTFPPSPSLPPPPTLQRAAPTDDSEGGGGAVVVPRSRSISVDGQGLPPASGSATPLRTSGGTGSRTPLSKGGASGYRYGYGQQQEVGVWKGGGDMCLSHTNVHTSLCLPWCSHLFCFHTCAGGPFGAGRPRCHECARSETQGGGGMALTGRGTLPLTCLLCL